ncbi:MAG: endolytic transglycosylase MltG [Clostridia bacterium]|nr:endolytic transglycosylase MltG [Clostridia bacterium]
MAQKKRRARGDEKRRINFISERYNIRSLHEDREYGMYWYAWLWKLLRPLLIFLCSALIVVGVVSVAYDRVYEALLAPMSQSGEVVTFEVQQGDSASTIGRKLEASKLLRNHSVFRYLVQFRGLTNKLSYGRFKLSPSMSVSQLIDELTSGSQTNERVITIVPGWTCEEIADYLMSIGALENRQAFLDLCNNVDLFVGSSYALRDAQNHNTLEGRKYALEGYLAPDTYRVFASASPESIIRTLLNQHNKIVDDVYYADHDEYYADQEGNYHEVERYKTDLTIDQIVTMASMIEREAAGREDYGRVAAVFYNRLRAGMKLESDPTATYVAGVKKLALSEQDISDPNLYNTYYVIGLPVGPICNPSQAAMEAAMSPDMTYINENYLYFCAMEPTSGKLAFSKTKEEHDANVALYRPLWEEYDRKREAERIAAVEKESED